MGIRYEEYIMQYKYLSYSTDMPASDTHFHSAVELSIAEKGRLKLCIGEKEIVLCENDGILVFPHTPHSFEPLDVDAKRVTYNFTSDFLPDFQNLFENSGVPFVYFESDNCPDFSLSAEKHLIDYAHSHKIGHVVVKSLLMVMVAGVLPAYTGKKFEEPCNKPGDFEFLCCLIDYINAHLKEDLTLEKLSKELNVVPSYISTLFSRRFNMKLGTYISSRRASLAESMLSSSKSIAEIASDSGFTGLRNFNRTFKEIYGMSPTEYRAKYFNT